MDVETEKLSIERAKLKLEEEKLELERYKAKLEASKAKWTAVSVAIPVVVALLTVAYGFWSARETARLQFQLEAAKSVMAAPNEENAANRLIAYKKFFPNELPSSFAIPKDPLEERVGVADAKKEFFKTVASIPGMTTQKALTIWIALFSDEWAREEELMRAMDLPRSTMPDAKQKRDALKPKESSK